MKQPLGKKKHRLCEIIGGRSYRVCYTRGGRTHGLAECWFGGTGDEIARDCDWVNYLTFEGPTPRIRQGIIVNFDIEKTTPA